MDQVLDYSSGPPRGADIKAAGFIGCARYLAPTPNRKVLTKAEAADLWSAGLSIALVWEAGADPLNTDAKKAGAQAGAEANALGFPLWVPIHYAFDFDESTTDYGPSVKWTADAAAASGHPGRGYGEYGLIAAFAAAGVPWGWQTAAWSGGKLSAHASLYQLVGTVTIDGVPCDRNDVRGADWGGFHPSQPAPPNPPNTGGHDVFVIVNDNGTDYRVGDDGEIKKVSDPKAITGWRRLGLASADVIVGPNGLPADEWAAMKAEAGVQ